MKQLLKGIGFLFAIILLPSCKKIGLCKDERLQIKRTDYSGNQIKTNGFYYCRLPNSTTVQYLVLYRNGVLLSGSVKDESQLEPRMLQLYQHPNFLKYRVGWGAFMLEGTSIYLEEIVDHYCGQAVVRHEAIIATDTSFVVHRSINRIGRKQTVYDKEETFRFRPFSPKPDSTTQYVP